MSNKGSFEHDINRKCRFLVFLGVWIILFLFVIGLTVPGIIISIQYSKDNCVTSSAINVQLDAWLIVSSIGIIGLSLISLCVLCVIPRSKFVKTWMFIFDLCIGAWAGIGWYLLYASTLNCTHDSLWLISLIHVATLSFTCIISTFYLFMSCMRWFRKKCSNQSRHDDLPIYNPSPPQFSHPGIMVYQ